VNHVLICHCGEVLLKSTDAVTKLRSKIVIFKGMSAIAVCKGCGAELPIPVRLDVSDLIQKSRNPKLFLLK